MTEDERREAERLAYETVGMIDLDQSFDRMRARGDFDHVWFVKGYAAACEAKRTPECHMAWLERDQAERGRALAIEEAARRLDEWNKCLGKLNLERARSANLINALKNLRHDGHAPRYITAVLDSYEASRDK